MVVTQTFAWKNVLANALATLTLLVSAFAFHDRIYDNRYAQISDAITVAQAEDITRQVSALKNSHDASEASSRQSDARFAAQLNQLSSQVGDLRVQSAVTVVSSLQQEYDRHLRNEEATRIWREERDRLKRQLERATDYRNCLLDERPNCDLLLR